MGACQTSSAGSRQTAAAPQSIRHFGDMSIELLCDACEDGDEKEVLAIIETGEVDVNEVFDDSTPLISAIVWKRPNIVRTLISNLNTRLDVVDSKGYTCLHWACYHDSAEIVKILGSVSRCTPDLINMKSVGGDSALMVCVWRASVDALKEMSKLEGCDLESKDAKGLTLLEVAGEKSDTLEVIEFLKTL